MLRMLLLVVLVGLLGLPGRSAVLPDGSQLPISDPDAPTATLPAAEPGGSPVKVSALGPASDPAATPLPGTGLGGGSGPVGQPGGAAGVKKPGSVGNQTAPKASPGAADAQSLWQPTGQPLPWSLIGLAVLLLLFSVGGGVYFSQSRDD